jgi:hypothetical protein
MAIQAQINTVVVFDKDHELPVKSTPQEIRNQIGAASTPHVPVLELKDPRGELVWVNAKQIRAYHAYRGE